MKKRYYFMNKNNNTFATAITCVDGRPILPIFSFGQKYFKVDVVDPVTEPGLDGVLLKIDDAAKNEIRRRAAVSIEKHNSQGILVVGHYDCAGNPVSDKEHKEHIRAAVKIVSSWGFSLPVVGVWVNENWDPEKVCEM